MCRMQRMHLRNLGRTTKMQRYRIEITDEALSDVEQLYNYIANDLLAPENAKKQYNRIADVLYTASDIEGRLR